MFYLDCLRHQQISSLPSPESDLAFKLFNLMNRLIAINSVNFWGRFWHKLKCQINVTLQFYWKKLKSSWTTTDTFECGKKAVCMHGEDIHWFIRQLFSCTETNSLKITHGSTFVVVMMTVLYCLVYKDNKERVCVYRDDLNRTMIQSRKKLSVWGLSL